MSIESEENNEIPTPTISELKGSLHNLNKLVNSKSKNYNYRNSFEFKTAINLLNAWGKAEPDLIFKGRFNDKMGDAGLEAISESLIQNTTNSIISSNDSNSEEIVEFKLKRLEIQKHDITTKGFLKLAEALKINNTLKYLCLDHNDMNDESALALMSVLNSHNKGLKSLNLEYNDLTDIFIEGLKETFSNDKHLRCLYLRGNKKITPYGATLFSQWIMEQKHIDNSKNIKKNIKIRSISLGSSLYSDETLSKMTEWIPYHKYIEEVFLHVSYAYHHISLCLQLIYTYFEGFKTE